MLRQLPQDESGIAIAEYGLLLALVALLLVGVLVVFGSDIGSWLSVNHAKLTSW